MKGMRILIIASAYPMPNSMEYAFVHARAKIYGKKGHQVKVFVPSEHDLTYEIEKVHVSRGGISAFKDVLKSFNPNIAAFHTPFYLTIRNHVKILEECKIPIVIWIHGSEAIFHAFLSGYVAPWEMRSMLRSILKDPLKLILLRKLFLKANAVVFVSKWMRNYTEHYLSFKHPLSVVIPNPVDTELFKYKPKNFEKASEGITVRALGWKYGLDIAIKAYAKIEKTHLTIVGSGPLENYLRGLAQRCHSTVFFITNYINHDEMPELFHKFGYFVAPSRVEAQGVAMCEAMACGLPVIATNVGGIPEFIEHKVNGLLISSENPHALRDEVVHLLSDERLYNSLSESGGKFVKERLSDTIYERERTLFKTCIEGR